jgi:prevent-host-death family protein
MVNLQNIHSLTEFKRNANSYIETIRSTKAPIVLTVNGEAAVVVQDAIAFQEILDRLTAAEEELEQMDLERLRREAEIGLKDLREGRITTYTADTIRDLADRIKAEGRSEIYQELLDIVDVARSAAVIQQ